MYHNYEFVRTETKGSLGSVRPMGSDIRLRGAKDTAWSAIAKDMKVYRNDRIFTGVNSHAKVQLKTNESFTIEPNSLIVITDEKDKQIIEFSNGGFLAEVKKGMRFFVKYKDTNAEISSDESATIRLGVSTSGALNLTVLRGEATVQKADRIQKVKTNEELDVTKEKAKSLPSNIVLLSPTPGEEKWTRDKTINLHWQTDVTTLKKIEIARDPEFKFIDQIISTNQNTADFGFPEAGTYFWRVSDTENPQLQSPISSFSVHNLIPPQVAAHAKIQIELTAEGRAKNPITFSWNDQLASDEYEFELSKVKDFSNIEQQQKVSTTSIEVLDLKPGNYFWRVRSLTKNRESLLSNTGEIALISPITVQRFSIKQQNTKEINIPTLKITPQRKPIKIALPEPAPDSTPKAKLQSPTPISRSIASSSNRNSSFGLGLWLGAGADILNFNQSSSNLQNGSFSNTSAPVLAAGAKIRFTKKSMLELQYSKWSGQIPTADSTLDKNKYDIQSMSAELQYRLSQNSKSYPSLLLGYKNEQSPFFAVNTSGESSLMQNELQAAFIGAKYNFLSSTKLRYETTFRYYFLTGIQNLNSADLKAQSSLWLDGSLGVSKYYNNGFNFGLYWTLQYQDLKYNLEYDGITNSGSQNMLNNNVQFRIGYDFWGLLIIPITIYRRRTNRKRF